MIKCYQQAKWRTVTRHCAAKFMKGAVIIMRAAPISRAMLERIPVYIDSLEAVAAQGQEYISATALAKAVGFGEVQVRKDLGYISGIGKPKIGYKTEELIYSLKKFLGSESCSQAVIVGAGKLGLALLDYMGFEQFGVHISAAFDIKPDAHSQTDKPVLPMDRLNEYCAKHSVKTGIISVPASAAQKACDEMVKAGIKAIWNFAPANLTVPDGIYVENERLAISLCLLDKKQKLI